MKISFHVWMKTNFHMKGWAPGLVLKRRPKISGNGPLAVSCWDWLNRPSFAPIVQFWICQPHYKQRSGSRRIFWLLLHPPRRICLVLKAFANWSLIVGIEVGDTKTKGLNMYVIRKAVHATRVKRECPLRPIGTWHMMKNRISSYFVHG